MTLSLNTGVSFVVGSQNSLGFSWITASPLRTGDNIAIILPNSYVTFSQTNTSVFTYDSKFISRSTLAGATSTQIRYNITALSTGDT